MFTKEDGKLKETLPCPEIVNVWSGKEIENNLQWAKDRRDVKLMELAGAEQEVERFEKMQKEAEKLGVMEDADTVDAVEEIIP